MADARALLERLPTLYRPEPDDGSLLSGFLDAVAGEAQRARDEAALVLPAHWFLHADHASLDPWFTRRRERANLPPLGSGELLDLADDRAFLAALRAGNTPLSRHLQAQLPSPLASALADWDALTPPPPALQRRVLDSLHRTVRGELLYDEARFAGVDLLPDTLQAVQAGPAPAEVPGLNARLLLEAFPAQLRPARLDLPWVRDLGRLAGIVPLVPWREPAALRESAESFRVRTARMLALFRHGLGTRAALQAAVESALPLLSGQPPERRDPPFSIEEFAPLRVLQVPASTSGPPPDVVGPLMQWTLENAGMAAVPASIYITGVAADAVQDATVDPALELVPAGGGWPRLALGYRGTLGSGQVLRLSPAFTTWLNGASGLERADQLPAADTAADPASPGPATAVAGAPADIVALQRTSDGVLWAAAANGSTLARFDGAAWTEDATSLAGIRCLTEHADALLLGTANGLLRRPLYPAEGDDASPTPVPGFADVAARTMTPAAGGGFWIGTDTGALFWSGSGAPEPIALGGESAINTTVRAIHADADRAVHFGCDLGVLEYQPARGAWYWYGGGSFSEQVPEWVPFGASPEPSPVDRAVFLPPVLAVHRGPDSSLWLGTSRGIARYLARAVEGHSYTTLLEAFPDLGVGPVTQITTDERSGVRFATERGLLRFDGRDWWQRRDGTWFHLGRGDLLPGGEARGAWRFVRALDEWQRFEPRRGSWLAAAPALRTAAEPAITQVLTTDHVTGELGAWEDDRFAAAAAVPAEQLVLRVKPDAVRILDGGLPFIPRLLPGTSRWRYLRLEPADLAEPDAAVRPAWSCEGRLFPPPPSLDAPFAGRYDVAGGEGQFDQAVFAYPPAARARFDFAPRRFCTVLVRLHQPAGAVPWDPAVLDRVWETMQLVRPAGVRTLLALNQTIVRES